MTGLPTSGNPSSADVVLIYLVYIWGVHRSSTYLGLRRGIEADAIQSFNELFVYIDQRTLFKDAGLNPYGPGQKRVNDPRLFTIAEVYQLAAFIGIPGLKLLEMINRDIGEWAKLIYNL